MTMSCLFPLPFKTQGCQVGRDDPKSQVKHYHIVNWIFNPHVLLVYETYLIPHKINNKKYAKIIKDKKSTQTKRILASCILVGNINGHHLQKFQWKSKQKS
jgi:hypothetical protein